MFLFLSLLLYLYLAFAFSHSVFYFYGSAQQLLFTFAVVYFPKCLHIYVCVSVCLFLLCHLHWQPEHDMRLLICYMLRSLITTVVVAYAIVGVVVSGSCCFMHSIVFPQHCCRLLAMLLPVLLLHAAYSLFIHMQACVCVCVCMYVHFFCVFSLYCARLYIALLFCCPCVN